MSTGQNALQKILKEQNLNLSENPRGTDKGDYKSYIDKYYSIAFENFKDKPIRLLEIGFRHGASLALWSFYFENGEITGVDNGTDEALKPENPVNKEWVTLPNVKIFNGNAYSESFLDALNGDFDVIIDDGPHTVQSQEFAVKYYSKKLKRGGILIVEDLQRGGRTILPLTKAVPRPFRGKFYDFRLNKFVYDNCLFVVKKPEHDGFLKNNLFFELYRLLNYFLFFFYFTVENFYITLFRIKKLAAKK